jgi:hypothetical protein
MEMHAIQSKQASMSSGCIVGNAYLTGLWKGCPSLENNRPGDKTDHICGRPFYRELFPDAEAREAQAASVLPGWNFAAEFVEEIEDECHLVHRGGLPGAGRLQHGEALAIRVKIKRVVEGSEVHELAR